MAARDGMHILMSLDQESVSYKTLLEWIAFLVHEPDYADYFVPEYLKVMRRIEDDLNAIV